MGIAEKIQIEAEFGPLWSGVTSISVGNRLFTSVEMKRALNLFSDDVVGIDLHPMNGGHFAYRFYDGDDRCIVVFVMDAELNILRELRAHIAEWLQDEYYESGIEAYLAGRMMKMLRKKVTGSLPDPEK